MKISFLKSITLACMCLVAIACDSTGVDKEFLPKPKPGDTDNTTTGKTITLNVATYNLRLLTTSDVEEKAWSERKVRVAGIIKKYGFDIFGTQEPVYSQLTDLLALCPDYAYTGLGRNDGTTTGEFSAVFYKKEKLELLDSGTFWLSQTPDTPSKGWDASLNRICSWGKFKDKVSEKEFYFFNTHFDHIGVIARKESATLLLAKMQAIAGKTDVFCTGDFNLAPNSEPIQAISNSKYVWDAKEITETLAQGTEGTFHGYDLSKTKAEYTNRIDYVFVSQKVKVKTYRVINDDLEVQLPASDHFPVLTKVEL